MRLLLWILFALGAAVAAYWIGTAQAAPSWSYWV